MALVWFKLVFLKKTRLVDGHVLISHVCIECDDVIGREGLPLAAVEQVMDPEPTLLGTGKFGEVHRVSLARAHVDDLEAGVGL